MSRGNLGRACSGAEEGEEGAVRVLGALRRWERPFQGKHRYISTPRAPLSRPMELLHETSGEHAPTSYLYA